MNLAGILPAARRITPRTVQGALVLGFVLVMIFLGFAGLVAVRQARGIRKSANGLVKEQLLIARLLNDVQVEENALSEVLHRLVMSPSNFSRAELLADLTRADQTLARLADGARRAPDAATWQALKTDAAQFTSRVRTVLQNDGPVPEGALTELFQLHDRVVEHSQTLLKTSTQHLTAADVKIEAQSQSLAEQSALLLGLCSLLAGACAVATLLYARHSIRRIESQSDELNKVSWHMLQSQEATARRFSHELHDELGQSLAAVRSNLTSRTNVSEAERRADCIHLVDEAIENVRTLSQLLRPVILDDFGLAASLRWLTDGFSQRTRVQVTCDSTLEDRLHTDTETHLFRIAQEALTNVARHSGATRVAVKLTRTGDRVCLLIEDDGKGIDQQRRRARHSLGLVGMSARARECGGELRLESAHPHGLRIIVDVPGRKPEEETAPTA